MNESRRPRLRSEFDITMTAEELSSALSAPRPRGVRLMGPVRTGKVLWASDWLAVYDLWRAGKLGIVSAGPEFYGHTDYVLLTSPLLNRARIA